MRCNGKIITSIFLLFLLPQLANAATVRVDQQWFRFIQIGAFTDPNLVANTVAFIDSSTVAGVGIELAPLTYFGLSYIDNGLPTTSVIATTPSDVTAQFQNGIFEFFSGNTTPWNVSGAGGFNVNTAIGELFWLFPGSGEWEFRLQTTDVILPAAPVPLPATAWLMAPALLLLTRFRNKSALPVPV